MIITSSEPIRLVIWDLDETLWRGTLSEGGIEHCENHYEIVRELARRGIMSSICSKNDFETVKSVLSTQGIWDYFVFPSIDWSSKGPRLRAIVDAAQLRPETVLFVDDHPFNRAEAMAAVPGLRAAPETVLCTLLDQADCAGKDDRQLERLAQYKLLEEKNRQKQNARDDLQFLHASRITVEIDHDCEAHLDRIVELINRTNQLNFTKKRLPEDSAAARAELAATLHATSGRRAGIVRVHDRYGDYGIVGFWMMDGIWVEPYLIHFAFSCRTLGMGVEQWVYDKLGRPRLDIVGEVVSGLDSVPDWVNLDAAPNAAVSHTRLPASQVRLQGGCELEVVRHFFSFEVGDLKSEFVFPRDGQVIWKSHSLTLFEQSSIRTEDARSALAQIGFKADDFNSNFLADVPSGSLLVLSNSGDAHVQLLQHNQLGFMVPFKLFGIDIANPTDAQITEYARNNRLDADQAARFRGMLEALRESYHAVSFEEIDWLGLYRKIVASVPSDAYLIFLLPISFADTPDGNGIVYAEQDELNRLVCEAAAGHDNIAVVHTLDCLSSRDDLRNFSHLHFRRDVYYRIYQRLRDSYLAWADRNRIDSEPTKTKEIRSATAI